MEMITVMAGAMGGMSGIICNGEANLYKWVVYCIKGILK